MNCYQRRFWTDVWAIAVVAIILFGVVAVIFL